MSEFRYTRPNNFPPIVKNLIIINALVWLAQVLFQKQYPVTDILQLSPIIPKQLDEIFSHTVAGYTSDVLFKPYQLVTHMFAHSPISPFHIIFNMFGLWMFGRILENVWGPKRFLLFYFACGLGSAALHLLIKYIGATHLLNEVSANPMLLTQATVDRTLAGAVGASGAIMGIFAAFAYLFPNTELYIMLIPVPVKAKWAVLGLAAIDLFGGVAQVSGDNIAHFAHLGGAITGFILVLIWNKTNRRTFY
jgi:membrane associated rhomboid family serine protease